MPKPDKDAIAEVMQKHGRWAALERDPELQERTEKILEEHGWVAEDGKSALGTIAAYARLANDDDINGLDPFGKRYTRREIAEGVSKKTKLGDARTVGKIFDLVGAADFHDGLLEKLSEQDFSKSRAPIREEDTLHASQQKALRARLGDALDREAFGAEAHKEARQEATEAALPPARSGAPPSIHDTVAAVMSALEKKKT